MVDFFFLPDAPMDDDAFAKTMADPLAHRVLDVVAERVDDVDWSATSLHELLNAISAELSWPLRKVQAPLRLALTGRLVGPPLFESMQILGRDVVRDRVAAAHERAAR
jgi:glutamyl-tRNA synthetase